MNEDIIKNLGFNATYGEEAMNMEMVEGAIRKNDDVIYKSLWMSNPQGFVAGGEPDW